MMPHKTVSSCSSCLQRGLNSRPLVYKTSALPLSYRGCLCRVSNLYHVLDDGQGTPQHMLAIAALILKLKVLVQRWTQPSIVKDGVELLI